MALTAIGQTTKQEVLDTPEKSGGVYYAYPSSNIPAETPAPKGYKAFYVSHFGRHGSRYLIFDEQYKEVLDFFADAHQAKALTSLGEDVYQRLQEVWKEAAHRAGDLSPLGKREHRGIAERMYHSYPDAFVKGAAVDARATTVVRCVLSMDAFCERLKELDPTLAIDRDASMFHQRYLNHHTEEAIAYRSAKDTWKEEYRKFVEDHLRPTRLVNSLFSSDEFITKRVNPNQLMMELYALASGMQNMECTISFYDLFEGEELFEIWQCENYKNYATDANYAGNNGLMFENGKPMLRRILARAKEVIEGGAHGASLRFAHDGNLIPMAMLLHLEGCYDSVSDPESFYKVWSNFKVSPMAGNIQMVFYRKKNSDEVLVKFLLHEREVLVPPIPTDKAPYYLWKDVEAYYNSIL